MSNLPLVPPITIGPVPSYSTFQYTGTFTEADGITAIPLASLLTVQLTLTDVDSGKVINSRQGTDVKNVNGAAISSGGVITWTPDDLDNPWVGHNPLPENGGKELHLAEIVWTWLHPSGRTLTGSRKVFINVKHTASLYTPNEAGSGASQCTLYLNNPVDGSPAVGITVWITSDAQGLVRVSGSLQTDTNGNVIFQLVNGGAYYLWAEAPNFTSIQGYTFIAEAD